MTTQVATSSSGQSVTPARYLVTALARWAQILGMFMIFLTVAFAATWLVVQRFTERPVALWELAGADAFWLIVVLAATTTLGVCALLIPTEKTRETNHPQLLEPAGATAEPDARRILRLAHAAERLDTVELDLIRTLAQGNHVDPGTKRLLAEMRVCTGRLLGELSDIGRDQPAA